MQPIYLDHAATTPLRPEVREAMMPYVEETFGNPSSTHRWGRAAAAALDGARARVAAALGAEPSEVIFVRGGTEGDNLAVLGRFHAALEESGSPLVATTAVEHSAVRDALPEVERLGGRSIRIPVAPDGALDPDVLERVLDDPELSVLSVMWVNNEVGTVFPVPELAARTRAAGAVLHSDAVQAVGKVDVDLREVSVDLLTVTGHKIYGPKGTGALVVRKGTNLAPRIFGGGQERGLRPGTQDVAGAVGLAKAVELAVEEREEEAGRMEGLRDALEALLKERIPGLRVHGADGFRAPHILNVGIPDADPNVLLPALDAEGLAVSAGSACHSGASGVSGVLGAMYGPDLVGWAPVRYSLGRSTAEEDLEAAARITTTVVDRLRA